VITLHKQTNNFHHCLAQHVMHIKHKIP